MTWTRLRQFVARGLALAVTLALAPGIAAGQPSRADTTLGKPAGGPLVFFDVMGGEDRRVRPNEDSDRAFAQCSPLVGLKGGLAKRFRSQWELAGALGVVERLVQDVHAAKQAREYFAEAEMNRYLARGAYVGGGLSVWDMVLRGSWTPACALHVGLPLSRNAHHEAFFIAEGRFFLDHATDLVSTYQVWGGVRVRIRR